MAELEETDATVSPPVPAPPTPEDELELEVTEELVAVAHDPSVVSLLLHAAVRRAIIPKPIANRFISFPFRFLLRAQGQIRTDTEKSLKLSPPAVGLPGHICYLCPPWDSNPP